MCLGGQSLKMLNRIIYKVMLIVCLSTWNLDGLKGFRLCGDLGVLENYTPDKICCNRMISDRVDVYKGERGCCSNKLYYKNAYDCVDGMLIELNRLDPVSTSDPNVPMKKVNIDGIVRSLYLAWQTYIRPATQTENSGRQMED